MFYLDFSGTFARADLFVEAAGFTIVLSAVAVVLGLIVGIIGAAMRLSGSRIASAIAIAYVEIIRNTPFLVQIYIVYFGLPSIGIRISAITAAILSLTIYAGAYITEIVRAGIITINKGQIEAARTLGMGPYLTFQHVILVPALSAIFPALTSQFILIMLASSVVSVISVPELGAQGQGRIPMQRFGSGADIGWAMTYLASDAAGYVSGQVLAVDGGALHAF
jgi:polar amino acid transport system permease protein